MQISIGCTDALTAPVIKRQGAGGGIPCPACAGSICIIGVFVSLTVNQSDCCCGGCLCVQLCKRQDQCDRSQHNKQCDEQAC